MKQKHTFTQPDIPEEFKQQYENKYVALHLEWESLFDHADDATAAALVRAIIKYAKYGTEPNLDGLGGAMFQMMRETINKDLDRGLSLSYNAELRKARRNGRENAKNGGNIKGEEEVEVEKEVEEVEIEDKTESGNRNNNLPTNPSHAPTHVGTGGSVGNSSGSAGQKPGSFYELEAFCKAIEHPEYDCSSLWEEMDRVNWEIYDKKSESLRPIKNWKKFVEYRIANSSQDYPYKTPEEKAIYEDWLKTDKSISFETYKQKRTSGGQDW